MRIQNRSFKPTTAVCGTLMLLVVLNWISIINFLQTTSGERAGFWFAQRHLQLGEDPKFILQTMGHGLPQPLELIVRWPEFLMATGISVFLIGGLLWLTLSMSRNEHQV